VLDPFSVYWTYPAFDWNLWFSSCIVDDLRCLGALGMEWRGTIVMGRWSWEDGKRRCNLL
jgi:hypothetical protein